MNRKVLLFSLFVIAAVFIIRNLVHEIFVSPDTHADLSKDWEKLLSDSLVIAGCLIVAVKFKLLYKGGFKGGNSKSYWMFLLPLFFPGVIMLPHYDTSCYAATFSFVVYLAAVLVRGLLEECVFRGVIQGYVIKHHPEKSIHFTCFFTAFLFSLVHLSNLRYYEGVGVAQQLVFAFYLGLLCSAMQFWMNNVWLLGLGHGLFNLIGSNFCKPEIVAEEGNKALLADYLIAIGTAILLMSPILIMYWVLVRSYKRRRHEIQEN